MRSSLFGFIDYYLNYLITILALFRLNYHLTEKSEFGKIASRAIFLLSLVIRG